MVAAFVKALRGRREQIATVGVLLGIVIVLVMGRGWWENTRTYPELVYPNKATFHRGGWFFNAEHDELYRLHGRWYLSGEEFLVPSNGPFNDVCVVRFEDHGRVYRVNKSEGTRTELRVVDGEWSARCDDGTWASIYQGY